jgi:hypothetical protein
MQTNSARSNYPDRPSSIFASLRVLCGKLIPSARGPNAAKCVKKFFRADLVAACRQRVASGSYFPVSCFRPTSQKNHVLTSQARCTEEPVKKYFRADLAATGGQRVPSGGYCQVPRFRSTSQKNPVLTSQARCRSTRHTESASG